MNIIKELIERNRAGEAIGLPCFCSANEHVLRSILSFTKKTGFPTVIEATCNQVNQYGGYTGMTAETFKNWLNTMASEIGVSMDQIILGGDHLGPNPWKNEPFDIAMEKARELVKSYVQAGFKKIHLDTSMACGGEASPTFKQIAERAADLCAVAEKYAPNPSDLFYIIGTEVPIPGGETEEPDALNLTSVERFHDTIETHRTAFAFRGLDNAWSRIISVVTQPGVDFGHTSIYPFISEKAKPLSKAILKIDKLTFEAHSTDYQSNTALKALTQNHFFFLKVGPELTFRFREAIWALAEIEEQISVNETSEIRNVLIHRMFESPANWKNYYSGLDDDVEQLMVYSYSDRIRYYWSDKYVASALSNLIINLSSKLLPETLISQSFMGHEFGNIPTNPNHLIEGHIHKCVNRYFEAAGFNYRNN